jgi:hypothetical protein
MSTCKRSQGLCAHVSKRGRVLQASFQAPKSAVGKELRPQH